VENCRFDRGHGASIGSIGQGCIQDVTFRHITITNQLSACRIKAYNEGVGYVRNIVWDNIDISNTKDCIQIDSNYKPSLVPDASIEISNITFSAITGTGCSVPGAFTCQAAAPCEGIHLINVDVSKNAKVDTITCVDAHGDAQNVKPPSCLQP